MVQTVSEETAKWYMSATAEEGHNAIKSLIEGFGSYREAFHAIDADRSGTLDMYELRSAVEGMGIKLRVEQAETLMDMYDKDGDGNIDLNEFIEAMEHLQKIGFGTGMVLVHDGDDAFEEEEEESWELDFEPGQSSIEQWLQRGWCQLELLIALLPVHNVETGGWERAEVYVADGDSCNVYPFDQVEGALKARYVENYSDGLPVHRQMNRLLKSQCQNRLNPLAKGQLFSVDADRSALVPLVQCVIDEYLVALASPNAGMQPTLHRGEVMDITRLKLYSFLMHMRRDAKAIEADGVEAYKPDFQTFFDDETGERFYLNLHTGESVWLLPEDQEKLDEERHQRDQEEIQNLIREGHLSFKDLKAWRAGDITLQEALALGNAAKAAEDEEKKAHKKKKKADKLARREERKNKRK